MAAGGFLRALVRDGRIDVAQWKAAVAGHLPVGKCPVCGGLLYGKPPQSYRNRTDFIAECDNCNQEMLAPGGKVLGRGRRGGNHA